ncbi:MAG TPA: zinc ribbon domain-containing protein [Xanthobacteraceae bacterium]
MAKAIADASWHSMKSKTAYKAEWSGKHLVVLDSWAATSKTCHVCGFKCSQMPLSVREWTCDNCGTLHDRDINAACTIKHFGILELRAGGWHVPVCGGLRKTGDMLAAACEAENRAARAA